MTRSAALEVNDLIMRYGDVTAVDGVSFRVEAGSVLVILGRNGAGKTSIIEACEGFRRPHRGTLRVLGLDPTAQRSALNRRMGVMLQGGGIYPGARVAETVAHYCTLHARGVRPDEVLERVGLDELRKRTWRTLSGGERQRLSLALALCARPDIAFLDEPTAGVDLDGRRAIRAIIEDLAAGGCAVILATHELDEAERCADDVLIVDRGRVVASGPLAGLLGQEIRFRLTTPIAPEAFASATSLAVSIDGDDYVVHGNAHTDTIAAIARVATDASSAVIDVRSGSQRLESLFRRLIEDVAS
jgi:ABC-2 type transport system ATP-binding protein